MPSANYDSSVDKDTLFVDEGETQESILERDKNKMFHGRIFVPIGGVLTLKQLNVNDYIPDDIINSWTLSIPNTYRYLAIYTRKYYRYGCTTCRCILPALGGSGSEFDVGFEPSSNSLLGLIGYRYNVSAKILYAYTGVVGVPLTNMLPADALTDYHTYEVKLDRDSAWFYIDRTIGTIGANGLWAVGMFPTHGLTVTINGPPYYIFCAGMINSPISPSWIEVEGGGSAMSVSMRQWYTMEDDPKPPRGLPLYQTGTNNKLATLAVNPNVTSHPIPTFGYNKVTIKFRADGAGSLSIQDLTDAGNWREVETQAIVANTLLTYIKSGSSLMTRVVFTPTIPPATITDADVVLQP